MEWNIEGEVWINFLKASGELDLCVGSWGISLPNRGGGDVGPHTNFNIKPDQFAEILSSENKGAINLTMSGDGLGKIDDCRGYPAADSGAQSRYIKNYILSIRREPDSTYFEFIGETGFIEPASVRPEYRKFIEAKGTYAFRIWFRVLDSKVANHFHDKISLEAITRYVNVCAIAKSVT